MPPKLRITMDVENPSPMHSIMDDSIALVQPMVNDHRRGFMGSQNRYRAGMHSQDRGGQPTTSNMNASSSVISEDDLGSVAVLWGTNLDVREIEHKTKNFVKNYSPSVGAI
jgi:hypothetical protein